MRTEYRTTLVRSSVQVASLSPHHPAHQAQQDRTRSAGSRRYAACNVAKSVKDLPLTGVAYLNLKAQGVGTTRAILDAAKVCETIVCWALAHQDLALGADWPTQIQYAEYWKINERTVRRELDRFSKAFPREESPERLARWVQSVAAERLNRDDFSPALSTRAPGWALPVAA
jgi:hypothetical protein